MASITALQLVNQVRLFRRQPPTTAFDTNEDTLTLQAVNMAITEILENNDWDFDIRHDGQLNLRALLDDCTVTGSAGSATPTLTRSSGLVDADMRGAYTTRLLIDGLADFANTSFVVSSAADVTGGVSSVLTLATAVPDASAALAAELHYAEYLLDDTIKGVIRVSYQEDEISLKQADPILRYDELFPNQSSSGPPEIVAIGGRDFGTIETGVTGTEPRLRVAVWPVPDDDYVLNYSYYYRHPELVTITDELIGVPIANVKDIVFKATSFVKMTWDSDYAGDHFNDMAEASSTRKHEISKTKSRRRTIGSFEGTRTGIPFERGFPNRLLG